jgi:CheY-like chemotaxis protein
MNMEESISDKKIMLIDDSSINRMVISRYLEQYNYNIIEITNGKNAINYLKINNTNILMIFTDIHMPMLNGIDMTIQLRKNGLNIPIIGITGSSDETTIKICLESGMNHVLCKPISKTDLYEVIDKFI